MKLIALLALALALPACSSTTVSRHGRSLLKIQADATNVTIRDGGFYFHADSLNHSRSTAAGANGTAKVIGTVGSRAAGILAAQATGALLKP